MTGPVIANQDQLGPRVLLALTLIALAALVVLAVMGPEPALQPTRITPATASQPVPYRP